MPVVSITLEDTNRTILTNAYQKVIQDIVDAIKIPYGTLVVLQKDIEVTLTDNRTNVNGQSQDNLPSTVSKRRILANITENYNEDEVTTTAVNQPSAYPIFIDHDISTVIYPIYIKSDISIEFIYNSPSKTEATRIRDDIRLRLSQLRNINIHEVDYAIIIPEVVEEFIADVYDLKSRLVPQSLEDYFREHSSKRIYAITDMANKENTKLAIDEKQVRIIGTYDLSGLPEKLEIDNESNNYKVSFTYKFSMDVPRAIAMRYPVMICNRPLPSKYLSFIEENKINSKEESKKELNYTSSSLYSLSHFEAHRQLENRVDIKLPINIPLFDEFNQRKGFSGYNNYVSFLTEVDETDNKSLLNLKELGDYSLDQTLLDFIQSQEYKYITKPYQSFILLTICQEDKHFNNDILEVDASLNVKSKATLSLFKPVRVVLSVILDLTMLSEAAIDRYIAEPRIFCLFLKEYIYALNNYKTETNNVIDDTLFRIVIKALKYYVSVDWDSGINCIISLFSQDKFLNEWFLKYLKSTSLFDILFKNGHFNITPSKLESGLMKTVMITYTEAYRK